MDDSNPIHSDAPKKQNDTAPNTPPPAKPVELNAAGERIAVDQTEEARVKAKEAQDSIEHGQKDILDRIKTGERWMIFFTAIVAFTTVGQFLQSGCNNASTAKQIDKIIGAAHTQACAAQQIAAASRRNATAAESFSLSAKGIETKTGEAVNNFQRLASATQQAANVARESLTSVQRAQMAFAGQLTVQKKIDQNKITDLTFTLPWENLGDTATVNTRDRANWKIFPNSGIPSDFDFADLPGNDQRQYDIPAKGYGRSTLTINPFDISLVTGKLGRIYVWGWMAYNDVFPGTPRHLTEFCDEITNFTATADDVTSPSTEFKWGDLSLCTTHNCYDKECKDYQERVKDMRQ
jgi:hypothetical protein